jgi:hypothetical protein
MLNRQLQEINLELSVQKSSTKRRASNEDAYLPRSKQSVVKSPTTNAISAFSPEKAPTPLSAKQEQILKSAMEMYGQGSKPKQSSKGWNFI